MSIANYSRVRLLTNRYSEYGVSQGASGYIIEVYDDGDYEVEFSGAGGVTIAQFAVRPDEVAVDEVQEISHATDFAA